MKKKILVACLCVALAVLTVAGTTLAYLTSQDKVTNTFTVGKVKITLDEAKVNDMGVVDTAETSRVKENTYKLMPGHEYAKDPTVHVEAGSEACYVYVKVENGLGNAEGGTKIAAQIIDNGWAALNGVANVYYKDVAASDAVTNLVVFEKFTMADTVDATALSALNNQTIVVTAYAIQKDGTGTAADAWTKAGFGSTTSGN